MYPSKEKGFMTFKRELPLNQAISERVKHFQEFISDFPEAKIREQAYRCMNCGVPFCHSGCPLGNMIPDFNDLAKNGDWAGAIERLHSTNNFPEFTGRVCPAPCEAACVLGINEPPVSIEFIERCIIDRAWKEGWIKPEPAAQKTGKRVAVVGSGPSGLAAAQQLARAGHAVTVFERDDEPGGLLMYGIPAFKLSKDVLKRRVDQLRAEGVEFKCNTWVGKDYSATELRDQYDAVLLTVGSTKSRRLDVPGADLKGIHLAMEFLPQQTRRVLGKAVTAEPIFATDKNVVVIGGGDTGSDCVGTSIRQGAKSVKSIELLPRPPLQRDASMPWPNWPMILRTSSSHEEGGDRDWSILTKSFSGDENGNVKQLNAVRLEWEGRQMKEVPGSEFSIECDLVLLALGFLHPEHDTVVKELGLQTDPRGNIAADSRYRTPDPSGKIFAAGDGRRGQSLVVWAIHEGREAARCIDIALMGSSRLPSAFSQGYDALPPLRDDED